MIGKKNKREEKRRESGTSIGDDKEKNRDTGRSKETDREKVNKWMKMSGEDQYAQSKKIHTVRYKRLY